jgi:hypothetical protein
VDQYTPRRSRAEGVGKPRVELLKADTELSTINVSMPDQLRRNALDKVDRNCKRDPRAYAVIAQRGYGTDSDYVPMTVKKWPSGIARVQRQIDLKKGYVRLILRQVTLHCAYDPDRNTLFETERGTDCCNPLTGAQTVRIAQCDCGKLARLDLEHSDIR